MLHSLQLLNKCEFTEFYITSRTTVMMFDSGQTLTVDNRFGDNSGVQWEVVNVDAGHEAILTKPGEVAKIIVDSVNRFQAL